MSRAGATCLLAITLIARASVSAGAAERACRGGDGRHGASDGMPSYCISADGTVDWHVYSGFRRYHAECHMCHGPDGEGSTFSPSLVGALKAIGYDKFKEIVARGLQDVNNAQQLVMPPLGQNLNVMCYIDDIYVYLKARSDGVLGRGRPAKHEPKPEAATESENACFGRN